MNAGPNRMKNENADLAEITTTKKRQVTIFQTRLSPQPQKKNQNETVAP